MPTYEYECQGCGDRFDAFQSINETALRRCKKCNGRLKRLIGAGGAVIFRGSGFYATDYRSEDYKKRSKEEKSPAPKRNSVDSSKKED
jgi:putative FmdB family regulatory protein